jgi:glucose-6-phosphate 1-dehydrogenase
VDSADVYADGRADEIIGRWLAARLWIDNPRWRDVPFYLRTGKRMAASKQRVSLILREPPGPLAGRLPRHGNVLSFSLAGDGQIDLFLVAKKPGPALDLDVARASIPLASLHGADPLPPYVRLIHDVLLGDRSLFTRPDGLAAVWRGRRGPAHGRLACWAQSTRRSEGRSAEPK